MTRWCLLGDRVLFLLLLRLRVHLRKPNVSGLEIGLVLALGLSEIYREDEVHTSNMSCWCTDQGSVNRFEVPSEIFILLRKEFLAHSDPRRYHTLKVSEKSY